MLPTENRMGLPSTVWFGERETWRSRTNDRSTDGDKPAWLRTRWMLRFGVATKSSYRSRRYGTPRRPTSLVMPLYRSYRMDAEKTSYFSRYFGPPAVTRLLTCFCHE